MERSFSKEVEALRLGTGETLRRCCNPA